MQEIGEVKNRFDLEQAIMACHNTSDDLELIAEGVMEEGLDRDKVTNTILGLMEIHRLRVDKAFAILEEMLSTGQFNTP